MIIVLEAILAPVFPDLPDEGLQISTRLPGEQRTNESTQQPTNQATQPPPTHRNMIASLFAMPAPSTQKKSFVSLPAFWGMASRAALFWMRPEAGLSVR